MRNKEINLDDYLDKNLADRTRDKFMALPDFYKSTDGKERYTNIEDAADCIKQEEWIAIARALRDGVIFTNGKPQTADELLAKALMRICERQAEEELEDEFKAGKSKEDELMTYADYVYQRRRDAQFED